MYAIKIDAQKCTGCNQCVDACPTQVLAMEKEKCVASKPEDCQGCQSCVGICEKQAIEVEEK
jgi:NAD-dependent dihydropyrimidine dehydrogenase PreA subunit